MIFLLDLYRRVTIIRLIYRPVRTVFSRYELRRLVSQRIAEHRPLKIVLAANKKFQEDWIPTEIYTVNMIKPRDWERYFPENSIDALLAEHVWEHLTRNEGILAATLCHKYLKPGGYLRVAVPDGFFPDQSYIDFVKPGGLGPSAYDHKILYTYKTAKEVFELAGFKVDLLEYFDEKGEFHFQHWHPEDGLIVRSMRFYDGRTFGNLKYRSLVLDAKK